VRSIALDNITPIGALQLDDGIDDTELSVGARRLSEAFPGKPETGTGPLGYFLFADFPRVDPKSAGWPEGTRFP